MDPLNVPLPQNLSLIEAINFCNRLWKLPIAEKIIFDFRRLRHVEPFTMALVSTELKRFCTSRDNTSFFAENFQHHTYAAHMGFFKAFGLDHGNAPGEAKGSSTYLPLTIIKVNELREKASDGCEHIGETIEQESSKLAKLLVRSETGVLVETLTYSFREIMRNVVEHSQSSMLEYSAQYWPSKGKVEIVVLDSGIGIRSSLATNPFINIDCDRDAIHLALMPGISGKMFKGIKKNKNDVWQNSGFGLYMTNRLCRNGGNFFICSGSSGLLLDSNGKQDIECSYAGTALRMIINSNNITNLSESLERYKDEGLSLIKKDPAFRALEIASASTMLSRDFKRKSFES